MIVCSDLFLVGDCEEGLLELGLDVAERMPEVLVAVASSEKETLHHGQGEVVVVLTCGRQLQRVPAELCCELLQVFSWVLTWKSELNVGLEVLKTFDRSRLNRL